MTTRFNVRKKVLGNLSPIRTASKNGSPSHSFAHAAVPAPSTSEPIAIDTHMFGEPEIMAAYLIPGKRPALIDPGPANTATNVIEALAELGITRLDSIVLTHIHLDHAGATAPLARAFPEARIYIHERVARHLADPTRLIEGARSVWGDRMEALYGIPETVDSNRIAALRDGDRIDLGDRQLETIETPGHTRAHITFCDRQTGAMVCGDALGLRLPGSRIIRPSTPPADCSHDDAVASIERLRGLNPSSLHLAHYGRVSQAPDAAFDRAILAIDEWRASFLKKSEEAESEEELLRSVNACVEATLEPVPPSVRRDFEAVNPTWLNIAGMTGEQQRQQRGLADAA